VLERYEYDAYGKQFVMDASWGTRSSSSYLFVEGLQGKRLDTVTLNYNFINRDERPSLMRFDEMDPSGAVDGSNLYQMERSNPVRFVDPMGLEEFDPDRFSKEMQASMREHGIPELDFSAPPPEPVSSPGSGYGRRAGEFEPDWLDTCPEDLMQGYANAANALTNLFWKSDWSRDIATHEYGNGHDVSVGTAEVGWTLILIWLLGPEAAEECPEPPAAAEELPSATYEIEIEIEGPDSMLGRGLGPYDPPPVNPGAGRGLGPLEPPDGWQYWMGN
jgi:RHS repeat-associated protein